MTEEEVPDFVDAVLATGCEMCAIGTHSYVFGDADLTQDHRDRIGDELIRIDEIFGCRDHLKFEIILYLRRIGRVYKEPATH